jgi:hypothetical protein
MLTETLLKIPFSVIGRCSLVPTSYWLQEKCAVTGGFWKDFTESEVAVFAHCYQFPFQSYRNSKKYNIEVPYVLYAGGHKEMSSILADQ